MEHAARKLEKRNRPPVSCEPCRTRKYRLKCNRALPCDTCVKRNKAASCHYASNAVRTVNKASGTAKTPDFKDRLDRLEKLVSSVLSRQGSSATKNDKGTSSLFSASGAELGPETPHLQESEDGQLNYIDPNHWESILEDIREVKEHLSPAQRDASSENHKSPIIMRESDASFLFGSASGVSIDDLLSLLPDRPICDMLLSWYFNTRFMALGIVHPGKFQEEYKAFHESPSEASPLWIALLCAILSVTAALRQMANLPSSGAVVVPSPRILQQATIQCLILGRYATANENAIEAFLLHMQSCYLSSGRLTTDMWFEMGTIVRLAIRMGYHRDPSSLPGISPFDGEMRRRLWLNIFQIDALMSFQAGFPSMIPSDFCDAQVPRNLEFSDLQPKMKALPPERPLSEHTIVSYTIVKSSVMTEFKKIVHHTQLPTAASYDTTLSLEHEMRRAYHNIPEAYRSRDVGCSFTDPTGLIIERCNIELLYLKGIIILLRRFVSYKAIDDLYLAPRRACVDAALQILDRQADINRACEQGGRLYEDRWMFTSLATHDFLLAAMVICLDLSVQLRSNDPPWLRERPYDSITEREYDALQTTCQIFTSQTPPSEETSLAAELISLMIRKVSENKTTATTADITMDLAYVDTMSHMIDGSEDIDWAILDQYFQDMDGSSANYTTGI